MAAEWYYAKNKQKVGPVTDAQLQELVRSGGLIRTDMVWKQGMAKWMQAGQVEGLFKDKPSQAVTSSVPPPLPDSLEVVPVVARSAPTLVLPWPAEERSGFSVKQWIGIGASGFMGFVGLVFVVVSLVQGGQGLCCGPMVFCAIGLVLWLSVFNGWMIYGRWVPVDGAGGWVELLKGGIFKREDGMVGTFVFLKNKKFIDIFVAGRLVDSWKILSWGMDSLEIQDMTGKASSFKGGKTLEQKQANPFHRDRTDDLPGTWMPIAGSGQWVQFTKDGAIVFSDGGAGRYTVTGEEPNEIIRITMADGSTREYRVMSLSKAQLVIVVGTEARTYSRHGAKTPATNTQHQEPSPMIPAKKVAVSEAASQDEGEDDGDEVEPDPIDTICPYCNVVWRERIKVGATMRCYHCLEDFVVYKLIDPPPVKLLSMFASRKCPQCGSVVELDVNRGYYSCKTCRVTWQ